MSNKQCLTEKEYRVLIAYVKYWVVENKFGTFQDALNYLCISLDKEDVIDHLGSCGWVWNEYLGTLGYEV